MKKNHPQVFLFCLMFCFQIILTHIPVFAVEYMPDTALIAHRQTEVQQRGQEFTRWAGNIRTGKAHITLTQTHSKTVTTLAYSPDGKFAVSGSEDESVKLWDIESGRLIRTMEGHKYKVSVATFTPDGQEIITGGSRGPIQIRDTATGVLLRTIDIGNHMVSSLDISSDGKTLIAGIVVDSGNDIFIYGFETGKLIRSINGHNRYINVVQFSPDNKYFLSASDDSNVKVWEVSSGTLIKTLSEHTRGVKAAVFSPDGRYIIAGAGYDALILFDWKAASSIWTKEIKGTIDCVDISPDGERILAGLGKDIFLMNAGTGETENHVNKNEFTNRLDSLVFSPDGAFFLSGSADCSVKQWNAKTGALIHDLGGNTVRFNTVVYSPDNKRFYSAIESMVLLTWDSASERLLKRLWTRNHIFTTVTPKAFTPDRSGLIYGSLNSNSEIKLLDTETSAIKWTLTGMAHGTECMALSPDEQYLITGSSSKEGFILNLFNTRTRELLWTDSWQEGKMGSSASFSPDGQYFTVSKGRKLVTYDTISQNKLIDITHDIGYGGYDSNVLRYSPDGSLLLHSDRSALFLRDAYTGKLLRTLEVEWIESAEFTPDSKYLLAGSQLKNLVLFETSSGRVLWKKEAHGGWIQSVAITSDGSQALSASHDGTIKLWTLPEGELISTIIATEDGKHLVFTPEGYFSGDEDLARKEVYIVDGLISYSIDQFFDTYYRPDIIEAKVAGKDITRLADTGLLTEAFEPPPDVILKAERTSGVFSLIGKEDSDYKIIDGKLKVRIEALDQGGGIDELRLFHNGARISGTTRGLSVLRNDQNSHTFTVQLSDGDNYLKAVGFSDSRVESNPALAVIHYSTPRKIEPTLWILAVGINEYKNGRYDLNYARNDAASFIDAVKQSARGLFSSIESRLLTDTNATRSGITTAIRSIQSGSKPEDVFMFFYAGHGIALEYKKTERFEFFFIPTDITQMTNFSQVEQLGISGPEFEELVSSVPARKQFLVLDACNSGAINTAFAVRGAGEEIALSRLSRATGSTLIAASREDQFAQEFARLGQGALTKAILDGLNGGAAQRNGQITVGSLKSYVETSLPELTEQYAGEAQYPTGFVFGQDFPIGLKK